MNPSTGHLIDPALYGGDHESLKEQGYEEVPEELRKAAIKKLNGKPEAYVSLNSGGKLSKWAKKKRNKRRMSKASRKANRS